MGLVISYLHFRERHRHDLGGEIPEFTIDPDLAFDLLKATQFLKIWILYQYVISVICYILLFICFIHESRNGFQFQSETVTNLIITEHDWF